MSIIFIILAIVAAGGVLSAIFEAQRQAREHKHNKEKLEQFEKEHPGR